MTTAAAAIIRRLTRRTMAAAAVVILLLLGGTFYLTKRLSAPVKEPDPVLSGRTCRREAAG